MNALEEQADNTKARELHWKPLSWLGTLSPTTANDAWDQPLWETLVCMTLGLEMPVLASLPRPNQRSTALCGHKKHGMDLFSDHTSTCTAHSGVTKAHDWSVGVLGPLFLTAGHTVSSQHQVTASAGQRRSNVEIKSYLQDTAGHSSLVFDLSITHDRIGSSCHVQQNGLISHPQDLDNPLSLAAQLKVNSYRQQHTDNQNISFLPVIMPTSSRMHGEFFASSFSTGPPRDHGALNCHWTDIVTKPIGQYVLVQTCSILHGPEEQSRPRGGKSIGITDQPQYPRL
jgi:hypothetical protein